MAESILGQLRAITRSPEFAQIPDRDKAASIRSFLAANDEEFANLSPVDQLDYTGQMIREASPGTFERIGAHLPVTGRAIQAFRGEQVPGAIGMGLERGQTTGVVGVGEGIAGLELEAGGLTREQIIDQRRQAIAQSPAWSRAALSVMGELAELGVIFGVAGPIADKVVSTVMRPVAGLAGEAIRRGSETLARAAATQAFRVHVAKRLGTDVLAGEMFGILDAMERQEIRPLDQFIVNPLAMAGLGTLFMGAGRAMRRFGPMRIQEAQQFAQIDPSLQGVAREGQRFVNMMADRMKIPREEAGEMVFKTMTGTASTEEMLAVRGLLQASPEFLKDEFGLHLVRMMKPVLQTTVQVGDISPSITFEHVRTRREQTVRPRSVDVAEFDRLEQMARNGEIRITSAEGPEHLVGRFRPSGPVAEAPPPTVAQGTEPFPTQASVAEARAGGAPGPRPMEPEPTILGQQPAPAAIPTAADVARQRAGMPPIQAPTGPVPSPILGPSGERLQRGQIHVESPMAPELSPAESIERTVLMPTAADVAAARAARIPGPPAVEAVRGTEKLIRDLGYDVSALQPEQRQRFMANSEALIDTELAWRGVDTAGMKPAEKIRLLQILPREPPGPPPGAIVPVSTPTGPSGQIMPSGEAKVISSTADPRGTAIQTGKGRTIVTPPKADGKVVLPKELLTEGARPGVPVGEIPVEFISKLRQGNEVVQIPAQPGVPERRLVTSPSSMTDTLTVTDQVTGDSFTVSMDHMVDLLRSGQIRPWRPGISFMSSSDLAADAQSIHSSMRGMKKADPVQYRELDNRLSAIITELQRRSGRLGEPIPSTEGRMKSMLKMLAEERGSVRVGSEGEPLPTRLTTLPKDNIIQGDAGAVGGRAFMAEDGRVVVKFPFGSHGTSTVVYANEASAYSGLRDIMTQHMERARLTEIAERAAQTRRVEMHEAPPSRGSYDPKGNLEGTLNGDVPPLNSSPWLSNGREFPMEAFILPGETKLVSLGEGGTKLRDGLVRVREMWEAGYGKKMVQYERGIKSVPKEHRISAREGEKSLFYQAIEDGKGATPEILEAYQRVVRPIVDEHMSLAKLIIPDEVAPLEPNYLPHRFEYERLQEIGSRRRNQFVEGIMEKQGISRGEAESLATRILDKQRNARISGSLEKERLNVPGYITDLDRAMAATVSMNERRLAEAQVFGPNYEKAKDWIGQIRNQYGDRAGNYAQKMFDLELGFLRPEVDTFTRGLIRWQAAKLSLSVIPNMSQSANTVMRTNITAFSRAFADWARNPKKAIEEARMAGAFINDLLSEMSSQGISFPAEGIPATILGKAKVTTEQLSTALFNAVENNFNRTLAFKSGQYYFDQQVAALKRNPSHTLSISRLREMGFSKDTVLAAGEGDLNLMRELAGKRISDATQFRSTPLNMPMAARSPYISMAYQFKTFALNQSRFMFNEVFGKHGDLPRRLRAIAMVSTVYPAYGVGAGKLRSFLMGPTLSSDSIDRAFEDPSIRNWMVAGIYALTMSGSLGIAADVAASAASGNEFSLRSFAIPPTVSTGLNMLSVAGSAWRGFVNQDPEEFERAGHSAAREFGGIGLTVSKALLGEPGIGE